MKVNFQKLQWRDFIKKPFVQIEQDADRINIGMRVDFAVAVFLVAVAAVFFTATR